MELRGDFMTTFICTKCRQELATKYMHKNNICVDCATNPTSKNNAQLQSSKTLYRDKKHLCKLFVVYFSAEEQREKFVCYDTITGIPYLIDSQTRYEGHAIIDSWFGVKLTYEQVALFSKKYAAESPLVNINTANWKQYFSVRNDAQPSNVKDFDSITRTSNIAFLSNNIYNGVI